MGENLALNMADHGYRVAVYNRTTAVTERFLTGNPDTPGGLVGAAALPDFVTALKKPRKIVILVKAGPPVDAVVEQLFGAGVADLRGFFGGGGRSISGARAHAAGGSLRRDVALERVAGA
jgi:hypothetical protein